MPLFYNFPLPFIRQLVDSSYVKLSIEADQTSTNEVSLLVTTSSNENLDQVRNSELKSWTEHKVYTQVLDLSQPKIYTRWVYTNKESNGKQTIKARLVVKGFQDKDAKNIRKDSPICSKESLQVILGIMTSHGWICNSMDIKTAFLLSKQLDQPIYLLPLKETNVPPGYIWKLSKRVYSLTDALQSWYLTLREELIMLGAVSSKYDQAIFTWYFENKLQGLITTNVDYFCFAGSETFKNKVINIICTLFRVKSEEVAKFQYIGLEIKKSNENIRIRQDEYVKKLGHIPLQNNRSLEDKISPTEITEARKLIGQLNWLATQTRPDLVH